MNIYTLLNEAISYIEDNLEDKIDYKKISQILEMNEYSAQNIFYVLCNISVSDYIRKRRLSNAGYDLYNTNETVMDIAIKYQYNNATSFSRAFEKYHGIKPSQVKKHPEGLKVFSRIRFDENIAQRKSIEYSIIEKNEFILYGICKKTDIAHIKEVAPKLWIEIEKKYKEIYDDFNYGMTSYKDRFNMQECAYWVLSDKKINKKGFSKIVIPKSKWIVFKIYSQETEDIQNTTQRFYKEFIPSTKYKFRELPELEYYHDNIVEFLIPIED